MTRYTWRIGDAGSKSFLCRSLVLNERSFEAWGKRSVTSLSPFYCLMVEMLGTEASPHGGFWGLDGTVVVGWLLLLGVWALLGCGLCASRIKSRSHIILPSFRSYKITIEIIPFEGLTGGVSFRPERIRLILKIIYTRSQSELISHFNNEDFSPN